MKPDKPLSMKKSIDHKPARKAVNSITAASQTLPQQETPDPAAPKLPPVMTTKSRNGKNGTGQSEKAEALDTRVSKKQPQPWVVVVRDEVGPFYPEFEVMAVDREEAEDKGVKQCHLENGDSESEDNGFSAAVAYNRADLQDMLRALDNVTEEAGESE